MILSKQAINNFKKAYFQDFGDRVNDNQAQMMGTRLLEFFALIYKAIPKEIKIHELVTKQYKYGTNNK